MGDGFVRGVSKTTDPAILADMPGFVSCEKDQERQKKYDFRRSEELRFRTTIQNKTKAFD
ncbi:MAG: hypothetical protein Q4C95_02200 [Planctomycetia bacterium]|nr:hypothetical protein [Planctomycetia bacterium]